MIVVNKSLFFTEVSVLFTLVALFLMSPSKYNFGWCLSAFLLTLFGVFLFFLQWKRGGDSFLSFEPVFIIVALVMGFTFPVFIYDGDPETLYLFSWNIPFSPNYVNSGAFVTGIALVSFILGSLSLGQLFPHIKAGKTPRNINSILLITLIIFLGAYVLLGGFKYYQSVYHGENDGKPSFMMLEVFIIALLELMLFTEFWNKTCDSKYRFKIINIAIPIITAILFGLVGNRTVCLYLLLPFVFFISQHYLRISFPQLIILICVGGALMVLLLFLRAGYSFDVAYDWYFFFIDLLIPNTTTYLAFEIVDKSGVTFGLSELGAILGVIPFGQSLFHLVTGIGREFTNPSDLFTLYLGSESGTGNSFISSSYLAFGLLGVIVLPYLFGRIVRILRNKASFSYYHFLSYYVLCGFAVYGVRTSLFYPLRFVFYCLLFALINSSLNKKPRNI